jgi:hypothetical protein
LRAVVRIPPSLRPLRPLHPTILHSQSYPPTPPPHRLRAWGVSSQRGLTRAHRAVRFAHQPPPSEQPARMRAHVCVFVRGLRVACARVCPVPVVRQRTRPTAWPYPVLPPLPSLPPPPRGPQLPTPGPCRQVASLNSQGYALSAVMDKLCDLILGEPSLSDIQKATMAVAVAECDKCVADGAEEELQLYALAARLQQAARAA